MRRRSLLGGIKSNFFVADLVSGFIHGYSTARKLRSAYSSFGIRIGVFGVGLQQNVGFVNNIFDENLIQNHATGQRLGFDRLYDQIGSRTLSGTGGLPLIRTDAGVITKVSDRVYAQYNGTSHYADTDSATPITDKDCTVFVVFESQASDSNQGVFNEVIIDGVNNKRTAIISDTRNTIFSHTRYYPNAPTNNTDLVFASQQPQSANRCYIFRKSGTTVEAYDETGSLIDTDTSSEVFSLDTVLELGRQLIGTLYFGGKIAELLINNTALSTTDRNAVLDNIKDFYSIT